MCPADGHERCQYCPTGNSAFPVGSSVQDYNRSVGRQHNGAVCLYRVDVAAFL
jgi:hypothetical protein